MNKTLLFIVFAILTALGLAGYLVVLLLRPEHAVAYVGTLVMLLGLVSASATTFYMLGKQQRTLEEVKTQTNGNLTALREQVESKDAQIAELQRQLVQVVGAAPPVP